MARRMLLRCVAVMVVLSLVGCGAVSPSTDGGSGGGAATGGGGSGGGEASGGGSATGGGAASGGGTATGGGSGTSLATFSYSPSWSGVTAVSVIGAFGTASDWTAPFITMTDDGAGHWSGSAQLAPGTYSYLFVVIGDAQGSATQRRFVVDPAAPVAACPMESPTYSTNMNPCSTMVTPQGAAATTYAITGKVNFDGAGAPGYLVVIESDEATTHHFFADRATTDAAGAYTLHVASGRWRLQVLTPTDLTQTDAQRDGRLLNAQKRAISSTFTVSGPVAVSTPELAFHDYGLMSPADAGGLTLPTTFSFTRAAWAANVRFQIYGSRDGGSNNIGDPWATSPAFDGGSFVFDGGFTTMQALEGAVRPDERYFWGTQHSEARDGGINWSAQSMVFPLSFH